MTSLIQTIQKDTIIWRSAYNFNPFLNSIFGLTMTQCLCGDGKYIRIQHKQSLYFLSYLRVKIFPDIVYNRHSYLSFIHTFQITHLHNLAIPGGSGQLTL